MSWEMQGCCPCLLDVISNLNQTDKRKAPNSPKNDRERNISNVNIELDVLEVSFWDALPVLLTSFRVRL